MAQPTFHDYTCVETDIDHRRYGSRIVPMKVLCLGLPRTGTDSLRRALKMLGINNVYHGLPAFFENPRDCEMWYQAHEAKYEGKGKVFVREEFKMLLGHWSQITFAAFSRKSSSRSIRRRKLFRKRGRRRYGISAYDPSLAG